MPRRLHESPDLPRLATAVFCLILALLPGLGLVLPGPDDHHRHGTKESRERVVLHHGDGNPHHAAPRLEQGQRELHAPCALCARLGKTQVLAPRPARVDLADASRFVGLATVRPPALLERHDPVSPRAPPRF